jgi:AcrR family transcriptional regulator
MAEVLTRGFSFCILETNNTTIVSIVYTQQSILVLSMLLLATQPPPSSRRTLRPEEQLIQDRVVAFSRERFYAEGFSKITVDEIAASLGMSKKTFYRAFDSKDALIEFLVEEKLNYIHANVHRILGAKRDFVEKLTEIMSFLAAQVSQMAGHFMYDVQRFHPHVWERVDSFRHTHIIDAMTKLLKQGEREGLVRASLNQRLFLLVFMAITDGVLKPTILAHESFSADDAIRQVMNLLFVGATTKRGREAFEKIQVRTAKQR